jgi:hypothetical protein
VVTKATSANNGRPIREVSRTTYSRRTPQEMDELRDKAREELLASGKDPSEITPAMLNKKIALPNRKGVYCTLIAMRAHGKYPLSVAPSTDCSHLCHNSRCVRPEHLVTEPRKLNHGRKNCLYKLRCTHCAKDMIVCAHTPQCLHAANWDNTSDDENSTSDEK